MFRLSLKWCDYLRNHKKSYYWCAGKFLFDSYEEAEDYALDLIEFGLKKVGKAKRPYFRVVDYKITPLEMYYDD